MADLFQQHIKPPVAPIGHVEPRLWIRRLALFENSKTLIRDIHLKPGLNIIWSPDMSSKDRDALAHGSGKTTFCRMLRACLGEPGLATDDQRTRIMTRLPDGFAATEIIIDGECWVALRSFGLGKSYATKADSIEEALARGPQESDPDSIDPVINEAFFTNLQGRSPLEVGDENIWDVFRAWLSRDQDCRLTDILAWRSPKTQSHSCAQQLSEANKLAMVRLALRALDPQEQQAAMREKELRKAEEDGRERQAYAEKRRHDRLAAVRDDLGVGKNVSLEDTLDQKGLVSLAEEKLKEAMRAELPKPPDMSALVEQLNTLHVEQATLAREKQASKNEAERGRDEAQRLRSEADLGEIDITQGKIRVCSICKVSIDEVLAEGCNISLEKCDIEALKSSIKEKQDKAVALEQEAQGLENKAQQLAAKIGQVEQQIQSVNKNLNAANTANQKSQKAALSAQDEIYRARRILDDVRSLSENEKDEPSPLPTKELETVRAQLTQGRKRAGQAIQDLEERYRGVMHAWLPKGVDGSVKLDGKGLKVFAQFSDRGEVSTAALDSLKILAFDLAVLHLATEEKADLPAFLIHDSPREADLDSVLYARLFELVYQWENETETPCFQYIITTTSAPPKDLRKDQFVKLTMSSTPPNERLFRRDLY
jgi:hypothetical protein